MCKVFSIISLVCVDVVCVAELSICRIAFVDYHKDWQHYCLLNVWIGNTGKNFIICDRDLLLANGQSIPCVYGHNHSGMEKFMSLMNMFNPMTQNNYDILITKITNVTEIVAIENDIRD